MNLKNYIHKLQQRPVRERERIAVIWTAVGFAFIFLIWIVSSKEMNKPAEQPVDGTSASLNDLKNDFQTGKDSIEDMMEQLPNQTETENTDPIQKNDDLNTDNDLQNLSENPDAANSPPDIPADAPGFPNKPVGNDSQGKPSVPHLP